MSIATNTLSWSLAPLGAKSAADRYRGETIAVLRSAGEKKKGSAGYKHVRSSGAKTNWRQTRLILCIPRGSPGWS
jgi:hypothetical protein